MIYRLGLLTGGLVALAIVGGAAGVALHRSRPKVPTEQTINAADQGTPNTTAWGARPPVGIQLTGRVNLRQSGRLGPLASHGSTHTTDEALVVWIDGSKVYRHHIKDEDEPLSPSTAARATRP